MLNALFFLTFSRVSVTSLLQVLADVSATSGVNALNDVCKAMLKAGRPGHIIKLRQRAGASVAALKFT